jgi:hypothetical protein
MQPGNSGTSAMNASSSALEKDSFTVGEELSALMGDERVPYEADRVLLVRQDGEKKACGCGELIVHTLKDRTGPTRTWHLGFFGSRFYVAMEEEMDLHDESENILTVIGAPARMS